MSGTTDQEFLENLDFQEKSLSPLSIPYLPTNKKRLADNEIHKFKTCIML